MQSGPCVAPTETFILNKQGCMQQTVSVFHAYSGGL